MVNIQRRIFMVFFFNWYFIDALDLDVDFDVDVDIDVDFDIGFDGYDYNKQKIKYLEINFQL